EVRVRADVADASILGAGEAVVAVAVDPAAARHREALADAALTGVGGRARVRVVAGRVVGLRRVRAGAGGRVACAGEMAGVERRAHDRIRSDADPGLARIG